LALLSVILVAVIILKSYSTTSAAQFPIGNNCEIISNRYPDKALFEKLAVWDKENTMNMEGYGIYQCYCKLNSSKRDLLDEESPCYAYHHSITVALIQKNCMTVGIVFLNTILKMFNVRLINGIGYHKRGTVVATMVMSVFLSQYINSGLILLFAFSDLGETPLKFIPINNMYRDFTDEWY
jgi:hypothetical protein